MKSLVRILRYVKNYKGLAALNVLSNLMSTLFDIFSLAMIIPLLNLIFEQSEADYVGYLEAGLPAFELSPGWAINTFYYYLSGYILESGPDGKLYALVFISALVGCMILLKNLCKYAALYFAAPMRSGIVRDLRDRLYAKVMDLPLAFFSEQKKGDIIARMSNDVQEVEWTILRSLEMLFRDPIHLIILFGALIWTSPQLTIFALVFIPIALLIIGRIGKSLKATSQKTQQQLGLLMTIIEETLGGVRIIKAFTAEAFSQRRFGSVNERYRDLVTKAHRKRDLASPVSETLGVIMVLVVVCFGGWLILGNRPVFGMSSDLEPAGFIFYIVVFSRLLEPGKSLTNAWYNLQKGAASEERIEQLLATVNPITDGAAAKSVTTFEQKVEFADVCFSYETENVLSDINLTIEKGKTVALVGPSGGGKSTLADLLPRFYDATAGAITVDGVPVSDCKLADLRKLMGIVTQESILFNDSVARNIAFGLDNVDMQAVQEAAKVANAHDFISQMENGYETNIGDRGTKLSGGQRQRISIARAILKNPPILILDEATSALDTESEKLVQDALYKLMANRTSLVIAHRLSTIQNADEIVVLVQGKIVERGSHSELLMKNGTYKRLYDLQSFD